MTMRTPSLLTTSPLVTALLLTAAGCTTPPAEAPYPYEDAAWRRERIALPPDFAPSLPSGEELLLFAPGMFEAGGEDFWSYVFWMRIDEPQPDVARLTEMFEAYYDGLVMAVAGDLDLLPKEAATVRIERVDDTSFRMHVDLVEPFRTKEPLTVHARITVADTSTDTTTLHVEASPQEPGHWIWQHLAEAMAAADREGPQG